MVTTHRCVSCAAELPGGIQGNCAVCFVKAGLSKRFPGRTAARRRRRRGGRRR